MVEMRQKRVTITLSKGDLEFFGSHSEISPSGLMRTAIKDYKKRLGESLDEEAKA